MVFLLFVATVVVTILADMLLRKIRGGADSAAAEGLAPNGGEPSGAEYPQRLLFNRSHVWALVEQATVNVGLDDFVQRLAGTIDRIETAAPGTIVQKGDRLWTIHFGDRSLTQRAPVGGRITKVNQAVVRDPSLVNRAPYDEGWIVEILPRSLAEDSAALLDRQGFRAWNDKARARLLQQMQPALGMVFGDAGQVRAGAARRMDREKWEQFADQFFGEID